MYTRSGTISGGTLASNATFTLATHTVTEDVTEALLTMTLVWSRSTSYRRDIRFWINGSSRVPDEFDYAPGGGEATISLITDLAEGDGVDFRAYASHVDARQYTSGSWSISGEIARIEVTPQSPTFHADYTITLPEQTGVTYSVDGDPAPGATVTVTATADPGYTLTGQSEWQHTYPELLYIGDTPVDRVYVGGELVQSIYHGNTLLWEAGGGWPATGQFGPQTVTGSDLEVGRFTIDEAGTYEIEMTAEAGGNGIAIYIFVDGTRVAGKNLGNPRQVTATRSVSAGAVVTFTMSPIAPPPQHSDGGTWSITPA